MQSMMHKCIMVKIGGSKKRKLSKNVNFAEIGECVNYAEIGGKIYNFCGNREGENAICIIRLGDGRLCHQQAFMKQI